MDWKVVIRDLRESGMTLAQIAAACPDDIGKTPGVSTISELGTGTSDEPGHSLGQRLLTLHRVRVKQPTKRTAKAERAQAADDDAIGDTLQVEARRFMGRADDDLAPAPSVAERRQPGNERRSTDKPRCGGANERPKG